LYFIGVVKIVFVDSARKEYKYFGKRLTDIV